MKKEINELMQIEDCVLNGDNGKSKENPYVLGRNIYYKSTKSNNSSYDDFYELFDIYVQPDKKSDGNKVATFIIQNPLNQAGRTRYICAFTGIDHNENKEFPGYASEFPMKYPNEIYCEKEVPQLISNRIDNDLLKLVTLLRISNPNEENLSKLIKCSNKVERDSKLVTDDIYCRISNNWLESWKDINKEIYR